MNLGVTQQILKVKPFVFSVLVPGRCFESFRNIKLKSHNNVMRPVTFLV